MRAVLLAENRYKKKQRNLALMKFSKYFKNLGYRVDYHGQGVKTDLLPHYDYIFYSTVFTYHFDADCEAINWYKTHYPYSEIVVGGVSASLMPEKFDEVVGIKPHVGLYRLVEQISPDYDLFPDHKMSGVSQVFTSRGCRNKCGFCAVGRLEPDYHINERWQDSIDLSKKSVMIHDNNLTAGDMGHFASVMDFLRKHKLRVTFDNGFDCRFFKDSHLEHMKGVNFESGGLRFAFDSMSQDGQIQEAIGKCIDAGIGKSKMQVYILYNFKDTFEEAFYRADQIRQLGARPYPQQYRPLNDVVRLNTHISEHWDKKMLADFRYYWMMPGVYSRQRWEDYIAGGGKP